MVTLIVGENDIDGSDDVVGENDIDGTVDGKALVLGFKEMDGELLGEAEIVGFKEGVEEDNAEGVYVGRDEGTVEMEGKLEVVLVAFTSSTLDMAFDMFVCWVNTWLLYATNDAATPAPTTNTPPISNDFLFLTIFP